MENGGVKRGAKAEETGDSGLAEIEWSRGMGVGGSIFDIYRCAEEPRKRVPSEAASVFREKRRTLAETAT